MSIASDIFQKIICIPNAPKKGAQETILFVVDQLEQHDVRLKGKRYNLISKGRDEYLLLLSKRCRHLETKANSFFNRYGSRSIVPHTGTDGEHLRDFYHHCYYSVFYATRYGLVKNKYFDCTDHSEIAKVLNGATIPSIKANSGLLTPQIQELQDLRNFSDYVLNTQQLSLYASPSTVSDAHTYVQTSISIWGVP